MKSKLTGTGTFFQQAQRRITVITRAVMFRLRRLWRDSRCCLWVPSCRTGRSTWSDYRSLGNSRELLVPAKLSPSLHYRSCCSITEQIDMVPLYTNCCMHSILLSAPSVPSVAGRNSIIILLALSDVWGTAVWQLCYLHINCRALSLQLQQTSQWLK